MTFRTFGEPFGRGFRFGQPDISSYVSRLINMDRANLVASWALSEVSGTAAADSSGNGQTGTYAASIGLNAIKFPDNTPAPLFDANADVITLPVATLDAPFDPTLGTLMIWLKVRAASVWTDGVSRIAFELGADASNRIYFNKPTVANRFDMFYVAGGTSKQNVNTSFSPTVWTCFAITWDKANDQVKMYINGAQVGSTLTGLGVWSGALSTTFSAIGNFSSAGGANFYDGYIKYPVIWKSALTPVQLALLSPASFLV